MCILHGDRLASLLRLSAHLYSLPAHLFPSTHTPLFSPQSQAESDMADLARLARKQGLRAAAAPPPGGLLDPWSLDFLLRRAADQVQVREVVRRLVACAPFTCVKGRKAHTPWGVC